MNKNKYIRLGKMGLVEIQEHPWFKGTDWDLIIGNGEKDQINQVFNPEDKKRVNFKEIGKDG